MKIDRRRIPKDDGRIRHEPEACLPILWNRHALRGRLRPMPPLNSIAITIMRYYDISTRWLMARLI
jgi:hypothetical protein